MNRFVTKVYLVFAMLLGFTLLAGCNNHDNNNDDDSGSALTAIAITSANPSIAMGLNLQFIATGTYEDGTSSDITNSTTWSSADPAVATINASGLATGIETGSTVIFGNHPGQSKHCQWIKQTIYGHRHVFGRHFA
jgi:hypothetical protein